MRSLGVASQVSSAPPWALSINLSPMSWALCKSMAMTRGKGKGASMQLSPVSWARCGQVVVAAGEGHLVCLEVGDAALREAGHVALGAEVACLSAAPLQEGAAAAALVAVGTWDRNVHMLALPSLAAACPPEALGGDVIPRRHVPFTPGITVCNLPFLEAKQCLENTCKC